MIDISLGWVGDDDRAVSPVIGVILMVAITVILAAVIGTFVLDLGQSAGNSAPQASLSVDTSTTNDEITIEHDGGDSLDSSQTRVVVEIAGTSHTFNEISNSIVLSVGGTARVIVTGDPDGDTNDEDAVDWNDDGTIDYEDTSDTFTGGISQGDQVTIELIDTESQRVIFSTTVTA